MRHTFPILLVVIAPSAATAAGPVVGEPAHKPLLLRQFISQHLGDILVGGVLIATALFVVFLLLLYLRDQWVTRKNKTLGAPDGTIPPSSDLNFVTVATFRTLPESEACKLYLDSEGLTVLLTDAETIRTDWLLSNAVGYAKIQVPKDQADKAASLLGQIRHQHEEPSKGADDNRCLACGAEMPSDAFRCQTCGWSFANSDEEDVDRGAEKSG